MQVIIVALCVGFWCLLTGIGLGWYWHGAADDNAEYARTSLTL